MKRLELVTDQTYDKKVGASGTPAIVYFYAPWSKPCESVGDILNELALNYDAKVSFFCMNIDENANIPATLGVKTIPCLYGVDNGAIVSQLAGRNPKVKIREFVEKVHDGGKSP